MEENLLIQKSKSRWIKEGDANSSYFHACIKARRTSNQIWALKTGAIWIEDVPGLREAIRLHFSNQFSEDPWIRPQLDVFDIVKVSPGQNNILCAPFALEEIISAVWSCEDNKSPGPDGFNFKFIKSFWALLRSEVCGMISEFSSHAKLPAGLLVCFISLIPKRDSPQAISDYCPITLIGCLYKIISKLLARRLKEVLSSIVSPNQTAFLPKRHILDGVVVVNEIVDFAKKTKECLILKIDFEKAYNSVNWSFLEDMLRKFGFCEKWISWMRATIFTGKSPILVNGRSTSEFAVSKGIRQGDPLAPSDSFSNCSRGPWQHDPEGSQFKSI